MVMSSTARVINEQGTTAYTFTITDENGTALASADVNALTLTLWNARTAAIINSRNGQSVLNTNNGTLHSTSGLFTWLVQPGDTTLVDTSLAEGLTEEHRFLLKWTYSSSTKVRYEEDAFLVKSLLKIT